MESSKHHCSKNSSGTLWWTCEQIETRSCFVLKTAVSQNRKLTQFALEADLNPNRFLCCAAHIGSVTNTNICFVTNTNLVCDVTNTILFCDKYKFGLWQIQNESHWIMLYDLSHMINLSFWVLFIYLRIDVFVSKSICFLTLSSLTLKPFGCTQNWPTLKYAHMKHGKTLQSIMSYLCSERLKL